MSHWKDSPIPDKFNIVWYPNGAWEVVFARPHGIYYTGNDKSVSENDFKGCKFSEVEGPPGFQAFSSFAHCEAVPAKNAKISLGPETGAVHCEDETCPWSRECANHTTAGDFRSESGISPKLRLSGNEVLCETYFSKADDERQDEPKINGGSGYVCLKHGRFIAEDPFASEDYDDYS